MKKTSQKFILLWIVALFLGQVHPYSGRLYARGVDNTGSYPGLILFSPVELCQNGSPFLPLKNPEKIPGFVLKKNGCDDGNLLLLQQPLNFVSLGVYPVFAGETLIRYQETSGFFPFHAFW